MLRNADRSWSEIGAGLGVSEQAAQRKYAAKIPASLPAEVEAAGAHFAQPLPRTARSASGEIGRFFGPTRHRIITVTGGRLSPR